MSYELSDETKKNIERTVGLPFDEIIKMSDDDLQGYIERKIGKKVKWPEGAKVDGLPIVTLEELERRMDKSIREAERREGKRKIVKIFSKEKDEER